MFTLVMFWFDLNSFKFFITSNGRDATDPQFSSAMLALTPTARVLFGVFGKFHHEIHTIQPDQSDCERITTPLGSVSLGSLSKMPVSGAVV